MTQKSSKATDNLEEAVRRNISTVLDRCLETPSARFVVRVLTALADFERETHREHVRTGLGNAKRKGQHLGRPRITANSAKIARLRAQGRSWKEIAQATGVGVGTVRNRFRATIAAKQVQVPTVQ